MRLCGRPERAAGAQAAARGVRESFSMPKEFLLPDLGEGIAEAQIVRVMIKPGEKVARDQSLMEVETDKAAVEIPSPYAGIAKQVHVKEGQTVNVGSVIVTFDEGEEAGKKEAKTETKPAARQPAPPAKSDARTPIGRTEPPMPTKPAATEADAPSGRTAAAAAPAVRKLAREMGVDLDRITGSGPGGRVTKEDVELSASRGAAPSAPSAGSAPGARREEQPARTVAVSRPMTPPGTPDQDKWGKVYREPLTQIRKTIAAQMKRSAFTAVHVTHGDEADISELDRVRRELNEATGNDPKLTVMSFLIRATCVALRRHPIFNSSFDEENNQIVYKDYINLGVAVDTERGLIVPVIRNADQLTLRGIASALRGIAEKVRTNQFGIEDLRGGTFTITNVGALGGTFSTPIINFPEVAILGLGRTKKTPVLRNGQLAEALMLPLNLSFDHRATDGANAARFTREIIGYMEMPAKLLLD